MAKPALVDLTTAQTDEPTLALVPTTLPELKLPKLDLAGLFSVYNANLAAAYEAQTVMLDAAHAIAKTQYGYAEQVVAQAKDALATKSLPKTEALLADTKAALEHAVAVTKDVVGLGVAAQRRVTELLAKRTQASFSELKALAA
jgi:hypothetical protein